MKKSLLVNLGLVWAALPALAGPPVPKVVAPVPGSTVEFIANQRQWEKPVLFAADVPTGRLFLERGRLVQARYDGQQLEALHHKGGSRKEKSSQLIKAHAYAVEFVGALPSATVRGEAPLAGRNNYFLGDDPTRWASDVPGYGEVRYQGLYPGTDLHFYTKGGQLEYDFELAAGADMNRIRLRYDGQDKLQIVNGALHIATSVGTVVEQRPYAYQLVAGQRVRIACEYALKDGNSVSFSLPKGYNAKLPLVIDPVLTYASYTGSTAENWGYSATYDSLGNLYSAGIVFSLGYPTTVGAYRVTFGGASDMGIIKYNPLAATSASSRLYATYIGGRSDDHPHTLVVDRSNNLVIMGTTSSNNYPTTAGALDPSYNGGSDIVVSKLNSTGSTMLASTYIGGTSDDGQVTFSSDLNINYGDEFRGDAITDRNNNVYVASVTESQNFPVGNGGFQTSYGGGDSDGLIFKLNTNLTAMTWGSFLGGSNTDAIYAVQLDSVNNVFVSGGTVSTNMPGRAGSYHATYQGGTTDGFVSRIAAAGNTLVRTSYLGTSSYDQAYLLQLNRRSEVYVYGQTSGAYPVSAGVYSNANSRQFIHKLNPTLTTSMFSTVVGNGTRSGTVSLSPTAFLVDVCGQILLAGWGGSSLGSGTIQGMPVTSNALQSTVTTGDYHYIMQLSANAQQLIYGTYYGNGSSHVDGGTSRFDKKGIIYEAMCVGGSTALNTTANAWSRTKPAGASYNNAAFKIDVLQLNADFIPTSTPNGSTRQADLCAPAQFYFNRPSVTGTSVLWNFGNGVTSNQNANVSATYQNPGNYPVRLTVFDTNGCLPSVTYIDTVKVYAVPEAQVNASSRQIICVGNTAIISATNLAANTPAIIYTWTAPGQPTLTGPTVTVSPTVTTLYTITISTPGSAGNCSDTDTVTVRVLNEPINASFVPTFTVTGNTRQAAQCAPAQFYFNRPAVVGTGVTWDFGNGQTSTIANGASMRYTTPGKYAVRLTVSNTNGCGQSVTEVDTVTVYAVPQPQVTPASRHAVCLGAGTTISATNLVSNTPNVVYTWTAPGQPTLTGATVSIVPAATVLYTVTASTPANVGSCSATDTITVRVLDRFVVSTGPTREICQGTSVTLSVSDAGPGARYTWTAPGQPTITGASPSIVVNPTTSVRYKVTVENSNSCQALDSVQVNVAPRPDITATASGTNIVNEPVAFTNTTTGATSYRWDFGDNSPVSTEPSPTHTYITAGAYQAVLTAVYGVSNCEESVTVPVTVKAFDLPNIITPGDNSLNETFRPFVSTESVEIKIFNRWGRLVFEQKNYVDGWGRDAAAGTYYYQIVNSRGETWKGWLEVVRAK